LKIVKSVGEKIQEEVSEVIERLAAESKGGRNSIHMSHRFDVPVVPAGIMMKMMVAGQETKSMRPNSKD
jgi:hypothetical protein